MKREEKTIAKNKKAFHEYEILETLEAGIELTGTEVRCCATTTASSPTASHSSETARCGCTTCTSRRTSTATSPIPIPTASASCCCTRSRSASCRSRSRRRHALVPVKMCFKDNSLVKVELAVARGKKLYDKRATMAARDSRREVERALKERSRY